MRCNSAAAFVNESSYGAAPNDAGIQMIDWSEIVLWLGASVLLALGWILPLRQYRSLLWASSALALITSLLPRPGNALGQYLFGEAGKAGRLPNEIFGIAWWLLGAWLVNGILDLVLRRTLFPNDNQPHARRLFADLVSALLYIIAFVGIMETVMKEPIAAVLATSGVLAIVIGLALQSTLGDVFSGLAINVDRPFGAGDWIALAPDVEGQIQEINWRSTRIRTLQQDFVIIPNSVVAKAIVTNHTHRGHAHSSMLWIPIDNSVHPSLVIETLESAANGSRNGVDIEGVVAYASKIDASTVTYGLLYPVADFSSRAAVQSELICRVVTALGDRQMTIGPAATAITILKRPLIRPLGP